jgi:hypothetical protein
MWIQERDPSLSFKGTIPDGPSRLRVAGGRVCTYIPFVAINNRVLTLWFETAILRSGVQVFNEQVPIDFKALPGFVTPSPSGTLNQFDMDAFVHASDGQLKATILGWRGDGDTSRDVYVLRTGFYDRG